MKYKITILIAVYNAKEYLKRCLDHLVNQTCDKKLFEVLMIDDCSTDGAGKLCDEYATKYDNFHVVHHKKNTGGPSTARNEAIKLAQGEYIFFHDTDDYMGEEAIERLIKWSDKWHPDIMLAKMGETNRKDYPRSMFDKNYESVTPYNSKIFRTLGPWKLYRLAFLREIGASFPLGMIYEDVIFNFHTFLVAKKISVVSDYDYYYWTIREDGTNLSLNKTDASHNYLNVDSRLKAIKLINERLDKYLDRSQDTTEITRKLMVYIYDAITYAINNTAKQSQLDELYELTKDWYDQKVFDGWDLKRCIVVSYFQKNQKLSDLKKIFKLIESNLVDVKYTKRKITLTINVFGLTAPKKSELVLACTRYPQMKVCYDADFILQPKGKTSSILKIKEFDDIFNIYQCQVDIRVSDLYESYKNNEKDITKPISWGAELKLDEGTMKLKLNSLAKEAYYSYAYIENDNLFIPDVSKKKNIYIRQFNKDINLKECSYIEYKKRPIKNRIIWSSLVKYGFNKTKLIVSSMYERTFDYSFSPLKRVIKCNAGGKKIRVYNNMWLSGIKKVFSHKDN